MSNKNKRIQVTITEEDRMNAGKFFNKESCLIATACRRVLKKDVSVGIIFISFNNEKIGTFSEELVPNWACYNSEEQKPYYNKEVVGKSFEIILD